MPILAKSYLIGTSLASMASLQSRNYTLKVPFQSLILTLQVGWFRPMDEKNTI